eukprot:3179945-Prymnesium_polylepis.1
MARVHGAAVAADAYGIHINTLTGPKGYFAAARRQGVDVPVAAQQGGYRWSVLSGAQISALRDYFEFTD